MEKASSTMHFFVIFLLAVLCLAFSNVPAARAEWPYCNSDADCKPFCGSRPSHCVNNVCTSCPLPRKQAEDSTHASNNQGSQASKVVGTTEWPYCKVNGDCKGWCGKSDPGECFMGACQCHPPPNKLQR